MSTLTLTFEVNDDLTSERIAEYRDAVLAGLANLDTDPRPYSLTSKQRELADKLLNDVYNPTIATNFIVINENELPVGAVNKETDGWRFIPWTSGHKSSRKGHGTREAAIPRWVGKHTFKQAQPRKAL